MSTTSPRIASGENAETNGDDWATLSLLARVKRGPETKFAVAKREPLHLELEGIYTSVKARPHPLLMAVMDMRRWRWQSP